MAVAVAATTRPPTKTATAAMSGATGPRRSDQAPADTVPMTPAASVDENAAE